MTEGIRKDLPKYKQIENELRSRITLGTYKPGERIPSETDLGEQFGVSRLTIQKSLKELQTDGLVERRAGSGTYVCPQKDARGHLFGLMIPGLGETEIFEPVCQGMAKAGRVEGHALLWGDTAHGSSDIEFRTRQLCEDYIARGVSGVFFAPIEGIPNKDSINTAITDMLTRAGIPIVLLDRCILPYPNRSRFDCVGIDNRRAGYRMGQHLIQCGARRPLFLAKQHSAPTVDARRVGFLEAVAAAGLNIRGGSVICDPSDTKAVAAILDEFKADAFLCANDITAVHLMQSLETLKVKVPDQVKVVGIDDVRYASHLRVPLTSLHQPCLEMGETAIGVMLSRIDKPALPARDVLIDCRIVVRQSCGSANGKQN